MNLIKTKPRSYIKTIIKKVIILLFALNLKRFKKLVLGFITFMLVINTNKKDRILAYILYIYYLIYFQKNSNNIEALINSNGKFNTITLTFILKLDL